jgi:hypothetical protein
MSDIVAIFFADSNFAVFSDLKMWREKELSLGD